MVSLIDVTKQIHKSDTAVFIRHIFEGRTENQTESWMRFIIKDINRDITQIQTRMYGDVQLSTCISS